mgnify:FL=1
MVYPKKSNVDRTVNGMEKINDPEFKKGLTNFWNIKNLKDEYKLLSQRYLKEYYPKIKNSEEYAKYVNKSNEDPIESMIQEITDLKKINNNAYYIDVIIKVQDGPVSSKTIRIKRRQLFVRERNVWKFDGCDENIYDIIK